MAKSIQERVREQIAKQDAVRKAAEEAPRRAAETASRRRLAALERRDERRFLLRTGEIEPRNAREAKIRDDAEREELLGDSGEGLF